MHFRDKRSVRKMRKKLRKCNVKKCKSECAKIHLVKQVPREAFGMDLFAFSILIFFCIFCILRICDFEGNGGHKSRYRFSPAWPLLRTSGRFRLERRGCTAKFFTSGNVTVASFSIPILELLGIGF